MLIGPKMLKGVCNVFDEVSNVAFQLGNTLNNHLTTECLKFWQSYGTIHLEPLDEKVRTHAGRDVYFLVSGSIDLRLHLMGWNAGTVQKVEQV